MFSLQTILKGTVIFVNVPKNISKLYAHVITHWNSKSLVSRLTVQYSQDIVMFIKKIPSSLNVVNLLKQSEKAWKLH